MIAVDERIQAGLAAEGMGLAISDRPRYVGELCCRPGPQIPLGPDVLVPAVDVAPTDVGVAPTGWDEPGADVKATALLESLLDEDQLASYRSTGTFWVPTPRGRVRLGRRYDLRLVSGFGGESSLCVEPNTWERLPEGDIWATLVLWLSTDPDRFFSVAHKGEPWHDPAPGASQRAHVTHSAPLADFLDTVLDRLAEAHGSAAPAPVGLRSGLPKLDRCLATLAPGAVVLVVGAAGSGRTSLAMNMACATARLFGRAHEPGDPARAHVVFASPRNDAATVAGRIVFHKAFATWGSTRMSEGEWRRLSTAFGRIADEPWIIHTEPASTCAALAPARSDAVERRVFVVDDVAAFGPDAAATTAGARELACANDAITVLTSTARSVEGLAPGVVDSADVVIAIDSPQRNPAAASCGVQRKKVRVVKNRHGPRLACAAVHIEAWGRFVAVEG